MAAEDEPARGFQAGGEDYDTQCMQGLAASGESREYFARGRIRHLRRWWVLQGLREPRTVVDYGCGTGDSAPLLAEAFPEASIVGLDPTASLLERARAVHAGPRVRFAHLAHDSAPAAADLIYLNGVLHHVEPPDREGLMLRLAGMLAPGGVLALFENNPLNPGTRYVMSRIPFDRDAVPLTARTARRLVHGAGLVACHGRSLFWFPRALAALRPLERGLGRLPFGAQYVVLARRPAGD